MPLGIQNCLRGRGIIIIAVNSRGVLELLSVFCLGADQTPATHNSTSTDDHPVSTDACRCLEGVFLEGEPHIISKRNPSESQDVCNRIQLSLNLDTSEWDQQYF